MPLGAPCIVLRQDTVRNEAYRRGIEATVEEDDLVVDVGTGSGLLALMAAKTDDLDAVKRGIDYLTSEQRANGDWKQEGIAGVFNRACGISYTQYRNIFPIWALARYARLYEEAPPPATEPARRGGAKPARRRRSPAPSRG